MARHARVKGIAGGIIGSFNSRNNDIGGYCGIGMLSLYAQQMNTDFFTFDLLHQVVSPANDLALSVAQTYNYMLVSAFKKHDIPLTSIKDVILSIKFNPPYEEKYHYFGSGLGDRYICTLEISANTGKVVFIKDGGICWPHNPNRESKRG